MGQQQQGPSRVAAVGPYIQSSTMPRGPVRHELLVKPAVYPDGTVNMPAQPDPQGKANTGETVTLTLTHVHFTFPLSLLPSWPWQTFACQFFC